MKHQSIIINKRLFIFGHTIYIYSYIYIIYSPNVYRNSHQIKNRSNFRFQNPAGFHSRAVKKVKRKKKGYCQPSHCTCPSKKIIIKSQPEHKFSLFQAGDLSIPAVHFKPTLIAKQHIFCEYFSFMCLYCHCAKTQWPLCWHHVHKCSSLSLTLDLNVTLLNRINPGTKVLLCLHSLPCLTKVKSSYVVW